MQGRLRGLLAAAALAAYAYILALPLTRGEGLPSAERGVFHTATIAYYLEAARLLLADGWWTDKTCLGFQDLVRFYPPVPLALLALLLRHTGDPGAAAAIAHGAAVGLLGVAVYSYARALGASTARSLLAPLLILAVPGYVGAIAVYWEYSRVLGDAAAFAALAALTRGLASGNGRTLAASGALAGVTVLTSLISAQWLAAAAAATLAVWALDAYRRGLGESVPAAARALARATLAWVAVAGWWVLPALLPWGLSHYLRVEAGLGEKLGVLASSLTLAPDPSAPTLLAPLLPLAVAAVAMRGRGKGDPLTPAAAAAAVAAYALVYGQGTRLVPVIGLLAGVAPLTATGRRGTALLALWLAVTLPAAVHYYTGAYTASLTPDYTYQDTDEYKVALWLASRGSAGFAYLMYGPVFHGNQWLHVFNPQARQVLSHYMEGCLNPAVFEVDYYLKETLNAEKAYRLLVRYNVTVVVVDSTWLESQPTVVQALERRGLLAPAEVNEYLRYSKAYYVVRPPDAPEPGAPLVRAEYWTPARILGAAASLLAAAALARRPSSR